MLLPSGVVPTSVTFIVLTVADGLFFFRGSERMNELLHCMIYNNLSKYNTRIFS